MKENCYNCEYLERKKGHFNCLYKKCNMGNRPFYPYRVPERAKWNIGFRVCHFKPKVKSINLKKKQDSILNYV